MCLRKDLSFPCGKCLECLQKKRSSWALRLKNEINQHHPKSNYFMTLTYRDSDLKYNLVILDKFGNQVLGDVEYDLGHQFYLVPTLSKRDVELFIKRLRKYVAPSRFKYFLCGEYCPSTGRPHYHLIIFGFPVIQFQKAVRLFNKAWRMGQVRKPWRLVDAQCAYATTYLITEPWQPEFSDKPWNKQSKGLGFNLVSEYDDKVYLTNSWYVNMLADAIYDTFSEIVDVEVTEKVWNKKTQSYISEKVIKSREVLKNVPDEYLDIIETLVVDFVRADTDKGQLRFAIPKYVRQKLFSKELRACLNLIAERQRNDKHNKYLEIYGEYDKLNPKNPMWKQHMMLKTKEFYKKLNKKYKDKNKYID